MCVYCYLSFQSQIWRLPLLTLIIRLSNWTTLTANLWFCVSKSVQSEVKWNNEVIDIDSNKTVALWLLALNELFHTAKCEFGGSLRRITKSGVYLQSEWIFIFRFIYPFNLAPIGSCTSIILFYPLVVITLTCAFCKVFMFTWWQHRGTCSNPQA